MAFAVLGALKSTLLGLGYGAILYSNREGAGKIGTVIGTQLIVCMKIALEDGPELILEYFYLDKYITDNQKTRVFGKKTKK